MLSREESNESEPVPGPCPLQAPAVQRVTVCCAVDVFVKVIVWPRFDEVSDGLKGFAVSFWGDDPELYPNLGAQEYRVAHASAHPLRVAKAEIFLVTGEFGEVR